MKWVHKIRLCFVLLVSITCLLSGMEVVGSPTVDYETMVNDQGTITILGCNTTETDISIPESIDGIPVTHISHHAFVNNGLTSVSIPDTIIDIGKYAFYDNELTSVNIPNSVTSIQKYTFYVNKLTSINIPDSVTSIQDGAFYDNKLTNVNIPDSVTRIGDNTFRKNELTKVIIKSKDTVIKNTAFNAQILPNGEVSSTWYDTLDISGKSFDFNAPRDGEVTLYSYPYPIVYSVIFNDNGADGNIPPAITVIANNKITKPEDPIKSGYVLDGWYKDSSLTERWDFDTEIVTENLELYAKWIDPRILTDEEVVVINGIIISYTGIKKDIIIPSILDQQEVVGIGSSAFNGKQLISVVIPDTVTSIEDFAFENNQLTSLTIPNSITFLRDRAFYNNQLTSVTIPDSVIWIANSTFAYNQLTHITIPDSVVSIAGHAFHNNKLTSVVIPDSVTYLGDNAFKDNQLTSIAISNSVETIMEGAFYNNRLAEVTISENVTKIDGNAFANNRLLSATIKSKDTIVDNTAFNSQTLSDGNVSSVWYQTPDLSGVPFDFNAPRDGEVTIYLCPTYSVVFNANGADSHIPPAITVLKNKTIPIPNNPVKAGYTFGGWYSDSTLTQTWNFDTDLVTENLTLYARWIAISYDNSSSSSSDEGTEEVEDNFYLGKENVSYNSNGDKEAIMEVYKNYIKYFIKKAKQKGKISISSSKEVDIIKVKINLQSIKDMQDKDLTLEVKTKEAILNIDTNKIDITTITAQIGEGIPLDDMTLLIEIAKTNKDKLKITESAIKKNDLALMISPVDVRFEISYKDKKYPVKGFKGFVSLYLQILKGIDVSKITTAVIFEKDGSIRHIPTYITTINGKHYAHISILTSGTYLLVYNQEVFSDVTANHKAKSDIEKMASRLVAQGKEDGTFSPSEAVTRGEFAKTIVKALGLKPVEIDKFADINRGSELLGYIGAAYRYGIIKGINENTFDPDSIITRQDAMTMLYRASTITIFEMNNKTIDISCYRDYSEVSAYAKEAIIWNISQQVIKAKSSDTIAPLDAITRAELCTIINRFLISAGLIK